MGGVSIVVFGLIAVAGAKIWVDNRVDFSNNRNLIVAAVTLVLGTGDFTLKFGAFALGGIGTATFGAILLYALLNRGDSAARRARLNASPARARARVAPNARRARDAPHCMQRGPQRPAAALSGALHVHS